MEVDVGGWMVEGQRAEIRSLGAGGRRLEVVGRRVEFGVSCQVGGRRSQWELGGQMREDGGFWGPRWEVAGWRWEVERKLVVGGRRSEVAGGLRSEMRGRS